MRKTERASRWVQVEALCLCAGLERQYGAASVERVKAVEAPSLVKRAALRLLQRRAPWPRIATTVLAEAKGETAVARLMGLSQ